MSTNNSRPGHDRRYNTYREPVEEISINEFRAAIENKKDIGTGADNTSYPMIKNLPGSGTIWLVELYNQILIGGNIPKDFRTTLIYHLKKKRTLERTLSTTTGQFPYSHVKEKHCKQY